MSVLDNGSLPAAVGFTLAGWLRQGARGRAVTEAMSSVRLRSRGMTPARRHAVGRQPAEGRAGAVADRRTSTSSCSTSPPAASTSGRAARSTASSPSCRRPAWRWSWRHRTCRRSSASRTGRSSCADGAFVAELDRAALDRARRPGVRLPARGRARRPATRLRQRAPQEPAAHRRRAHGPRPAPPCHRPPRRTCDEHARGSARSAVQRHGNRPGARRALQRRLVPRPAHPRTRWSW